MRICSPQLGLSPKSVLGGEVYDREILLGLAKKEIKINIILPKNSEHDLNVRNWEITYIPFRHLPAPLFNLFFLPYLFKVYRKNKFEILRLHSPQNIGLSALLFKLFHPSVKIVATYHQFNETRIFGFGKFINRYWDHIICDSKNVKSKIVQELGVSGNKITAIHNGVPNYLKPTEKDKKLLQDLNLEGKIILLYTGLFIKRKNPLFLLKLLKKLKNKNVAIIFWGKGPQEEEILKSAKALEVESLIRIIKPKYGLEKNKIHNLADIFVHPAIDEGFALTPLEAMACAKPVIMNNVHSAKEAVDNGINGFLCRLGDEAQWMSAILSLIENPKLKEKMGNMSLVKVKKEFQWSLSINRHLKVFEQTAK